MKAGPDRRYTEEFRATAVRQVLDGRGAAKVARGLEMSVKTLNNWVARARKGQAVVKRLPVVAVNDMQAENARLHQENARLRMDREILKKAAALFAKEST